MYSIIKKKILQPIFQGFLNIYFKIFQRFFRSILRGEQRNRRRLSVAVRERRPYAFDNRVERIVEIYLIETEQTALKRLVKRAVRTAYIIRYLEHD